MDEKGWKILKINLLIKFKFKVDLVTHLKNTDTDNKANVADKDTYCGKEHFLWASLWWAIIRRSSSKVGGEVVILLEQGWSDTQVN